MVVLADFANFTGDTVFDDTLKQALSTELQQSPFWNILPDRRVSDTLKLMGRPLNARLDEKTGNRFRPLVKRRCWTRWAGLLGGLRESLGESLKSLQTYDTGLEQATTPSLEALQAYRRGRKARNLSRQLLALAPRSGGNQAEAAYETEIAFPGSPLRQCD
jgi:eukaryotic-like serine/threonine-protein kinase